MKCTKIKIFSIFSFLIIFGTFSSAAIFCPHAFISFDSQFAELKKMFSGKKISSSEARSSTHRLLSDFLGTVTDQIDESFKRLAPSDFMTLKGVTHDLYGTPAMAPYFNADALPVQKKSGTYGLKSFMNWLLQVGEPLEGSYTITDEVNDWRTNTVPQIPLENRNHLARVFGNMLYNASKNPYFDSANILNLFQGRF